jgi:hypothetical protein
MTETNREHAENGSMLRAAVAALLLILAGLSLMVLDESLDMVTSAQASFAQQR